MQKTRKKAELNGYDETINLTANWTCQVTYDYPPDSNETTFNALQPFDQNFISAWELDFNNSTSIIGGKVKIKVSAEIEEKIYSDSVIVYIRGENPDEEDVIDGLDNGEITVLETETIDFDQFDTEDYADPNEGLPLRSDIDSTGWGLCQIDQGSHHITTAILWNWRANLDYGMDYYNEMRDGAETRLENTGNLDTPADGQTRQSMIDSEGYARYNGGPSARYWSWLKPTRTNPVAHWIINPTAIRRGSRKPNPDIRKNVGNYLDNY